MSIFRDELRTAIAEWHDAMNAEDIEEVRKEAGKKLESLIMRAVDMRALRLAIVEGQNESAVE